MKAKDLMTRNVQCISPEMPLQEAAAMMKKLDVGFLPVCENDRLAGTVTDRDIVLRVVAEGKDIKNCTAADVMTRTVRWCQEDQSADEVADYMAQHEIRRILVLDENRRLSGVITIGDLAKRGEEEKAGETTREIAEAPPAHAA
jgi:CBS domain-containing protein